MAQASDANMSNIVKTYDHDNQGRLLLEDNADDPEFDLVADQTVSVNTVGAGGGCGCSGNTTGDPKTADLVLAGDGVLQTVTNYDYGVGTSAPGSGQTFSALTVPGPSGPGVSGGMVVHDEVWTEAGFFDRYNHEDQLGSLIGTSDADGRPKDELIYSEYGEPLAQKVAFSARPEDIDSVSYDATHKETTIDFTGVTVSSNVVGDGMEVRVAVPGDTTKRYRTARVQHVNASSNSLVLWEPTATYGESVAAAVDPNGSINAGLVVYDNPTGMVDGRWDSFNYVYPVATFSDSERAFPSYYDSFTVEVEFKVGSSTFRKPVHGVTQAGDLEVLLTTSEAQQFSGGERYRAPKLDGQGKKEESNSGIWYQDPTYDSGSDRTTFYAEPSANFKTHQVGWKLMPNSQRPSYYEILAVSDDTVTVGGDLTSPALAIGGDWFRVITPYAVDSDTGRLPENPWPITPRASTWAGYRYMPPAVGFSNLLGTPTGVSQTGGNELGSYYCFNRTYDPSQGRWTTPDPAASPWGNLQDYVGSNPLGRTDPSGLFSSWIPGYRWIQDTRWVPEGGGKPRAGWPTHNSITKSALGGSSVPDCLHEAVMRGATEIDIPAARWGHGGNAALHVDDTRTLKDTAEWLEAVRDAGNHYRNTGKVDCGCLGHLAYLAGMAAHTIQDFYHHTDWAFRKPFTRWDETRKSAHAAGVSTGYGWVKDGDINGQAPGAARVGNWKHDPWGDHKDDHGRAGLPAVPMPHNSRLAFLLQTVNSVVGPHTRDLLNDVAGGLEIGCCCPNGRLAKPAYEYRNPVKGSLTKCFGADAGGRLARFVITQRPQPKHPGGG